VVVGLVVLRPLQPQAVSQFLVQFFHWVVASVAVVPKVVERVVAVVVLGMVVLRVQEQRIKVSTVAVQAVLRVLVAVAERVK
jgi:hypothetical protein